MFCQHDIFIYLIVSTIIFSIQYCELKEITELENEVNRIKMNNELERKRLFYNNYLNLLHMKRKRGIYFRHLLKDLNHNIDERILQNSFHQNPIQSKAALRGLKQNLNKEILKDNLQLLQDQTKISLLKLQNSFLENFYDNNKQTKYENTLHPTKKLRTRRSDDTATDDSENQEENDNNNGATEGTKELLQEIVEELDEIRESSIGPRKGKLCQLNGTWISDRVGVAFKISFRQKHNNTIHNTTKESSTTQRTTTTTTTTPKPLKETTIGYVDLNTYEVEPDDNMDHGPMLNCSWKITAKIPFTHSTMLIINAEHPPTNVAVFVGQCRYCDKSEMVVGQWIFHRYAHDCRKINDAQDIYGDVLRRKRKAE